MDYDVLILGGGIIGCASAYELSKYSLNIALIEKDYDIADDISLINTEIVYDGVETFDSLASKLEHMGNSIFDEVTTKFNIPFKRYGSIMVSRNEEEHEKLLKVYNRAIKEGNKKIKLLDSNEVYKLEPNLNIKVKSGLYSENTGVVCPYDLAIAYGEVAFDNGVNFRLQEEVLNIEKISRGFRVTTNKNKFTCKVVLNTIPGNKYKIDIEERNIELRERKDLQYFQIDKSFKGGFSNIIFMMNDNKELLFTAPTVLGDRIVAVNSNSSLSYEDTFKRLNPLISGLSEDQIGGFFQTNFYSNSILIDDSQIDKGYIKVVGKHYGEVTITPYLSKIICETITSNLNSKLKKNFNDKRRDFFRFRELSLEEKDALIKLDKKYGKIVCVCKEVTEGEIVDAIRRPLGARTVEGLKRRCGVTLGDCQGSYCINKIVSILARETNKSIGEIMKRSKDSKETIGRIKEFNEM